MSSEADFRDRIIQFAYWELCNQQGGKPTEGQLLKYLRNSGTGYTSFDQTGADILRKGWCGIFAVYCIRSAGLPVYWGINKSFNKWGICGPVEWTSGTDGMTRGDAAIGWGGAGHETAGNHHFLIAETNDFGEGTEALCLDGNGNPPGNQQFLGGVITWIYRPLDKVASHYKLIWS
jgi:hypothetical protein